jgi:hypothetical protein
VIDKAGRHAPGFFLPSRAVKPKIIRAGDDAQISSERQTLLIPGSATSCHRFTYILAMSQTSKCKHKEESSR